jgi:anthranilate synthase component 1
VRLKNSTLEAMPIAGTRPLKGGELDLLMEQELLQDAKEEAEHMMLVDLGRNDLGAVSEIGTVKVAVLKKVQRFSHVMHLVSLVQSTLKKGLTFQDVLKATFPAGTLSGAPKIRAMQLIDELEQTRRGVYGGAICSIDNLGNMDSCIAIRMAVVKEGIATVRTGAGIVLDSDPMKEADETRHKARGMLQALKLAEESNVL